ncbi:MAG: serine hydrolase [Gammaproteobacteria bacterium]|nr:MAG: serine hydrolase [Gammaproteobacteria bacterium]
MTHSSFPSATRQMLLSRRQLLTYGALGAGTLAFPALAIPGTDLQRQLNGLIRQQRHRGQLSYHERTAWSVYDLQTRQKLVAINENHPMQAASMIKVFVALAYFYLNSQAPGKYPYHDKQRYLMEKMLVNSSNKATNTLMRLCKGPANIKRLCQRATNNRFRQLHIVEYIPAGGRTYRNRVSAHDYSRFLYDLWHHRLPHSAELKRIMAIKNHDRITTAAMQAKVFDKTGSTGMLCGDMGIVQLSHNKAYTFVGIIQRSRKTRRYGHWISQRSDAMRAASELVYRFMQQRYHLLHSIG